MDVVRRALGAVCAQLPPNSYVWSNWRRFARDPRRFIEEVSRTWGDYPREKAFVVYADGGIELFYGTTSYVTMPIDLSRRPVAKIHVHPLFVPCPSLPDIEAALALARVVPDIQCFVCTRVDLGTALCARYYPCRNLKELVELSKRVAIHRETTIVRDESGEIIAVVMSRRGFEEVVKELKKVVDLIEVGVPVAIRHPLDVFEAT
ncbi:MAG: hypothetical protein GXO32_05065 [Crenarchaeota archaeon]|nr:hypothetical protein [Thermoproteota archaeon]